MDKTVQVRSGGIGVFGLLGIAFIVLKITGYIQWSWWWVTAPLWMPWAVLLGVAIIALVFIGIVIVGESSVDAYRRWREKPKAKKWPTR